MQLNFMVRFITVNAIAVGSVFMNADVIHAQCSGGTMEGVLVPTSSWQTATGATAGKYYKFRATAGTSYQFTFCPANGGAASFDTELTLLTNTGAFAGAYNDDDCGLLSNLYWTATITDTFRILINEFPCSTNGISTTLAYRTVPPNPHDQKCAAKVLTVNAAPVNMDNIAASPNVLPPVPSCYSDGSVDNDVWAVFVAPAGGTVAVETFFGSIFGTQLSLYTSNPASSCSGIMTEVACNEWGGSSSLAYASGLTPGDSIFVRIDGYFGARTQ
jgi:hypothetical protein